MARANGNPADVGTRTADLVEWTLTDHLNTVRGIAKFDPETGATTVVNHLTYDAFGRLTSETNPAVDSSFLFTARPFDGETKQVENLPQEHFGQQSTPKNLNRWYDASVGRRLSEDPVGFDAGDGNVDRYCRNAPTTTLDPHGLRIVKCTDLFGDVRYVQVPSTWYASDNPCPELFGFGWEKGQLDVGETLVIRLCEGLPSNVRVHCEKYVVSILEGKRAADQTAIGTIQGWLEEHGIGPWGGRCHLWAGTFLDKVDAPPKPLQPYIRGPISVIVSLDPKSGWTTHHIVLVNNTHSGR